MENNSTFNLPNGKVAFGSTFPLTSNGQNIRINAPSFGYNNYTMKLAGNQTSVWQRNKLGVETGGANTPAGDSEVYFSESGLVCDISGGITTFNLPDLTNRVPMRRAGNALGLKEAGFIPNISGSVGGAYNYVFGSGTGVFKSASKGTTNNVGISRTGNIYNAVDFNAAWSNSIYANVDGVYPRNLAIYGYLIKY